MSREKIGANGLFTLDFFLNCCDCNLLLRFIHKCVCTKIAKMGTQPIRQPKELRKYLENSREKKPV